MSPSPPPPNRSSMFGAAGAADAGLAEAVVAGPLLVVGQHGVGPGDLLEALGRVRVVGVGVGVQLAGPLAVRLLELVGASPWRDARAARSSRPSRLSQPSAEAVADDVDGRQRLRVVHAGRAEHADRADVLAVDDAPARRRPSRPTAARRRARRRSPPTCRGRRCRARARRPRTAARACAAPGARRRRRRTPRRPWTRRRRRRGRRCRPVRAAAIAVAHSASTTASSDGGIDATTGQRRARQRRREVCRGRARARRR